MPKRKLKSPQQIWETISSNLVHFVENVFFNIGVKVATYPWVTIAVSWAIVLLSCIGLMNFYIEKNPMKLWVPPDSDFIKDTDWYIEKFETGFRFQKILITADNVLDPEILIAVNNITTEINKIKINYKGETFSLQDLCFMVPIINLFTSNQKTRSENGNASKSVKSSEVSDSEFYDPTLWVDDDFYCNFLDSFSMTCLQYNILDLWKNDPVLIKNTTRHEIVHKINSIKTNPITGHPVDYTKLLGDLKYDNSGDIVSAGALLLTWYTQVNMSAVNLNEVGNLVGTEDWVSPPLAMWEAEFLKVMESFSAKDFGFKIYYESGRSFADISGQAMFHDLDKLFLGIFLMFVYIQFALSRCNWLEVKLTLGSVGLLCVGMAYISAVSWCSIIGIPFGPVHSSLPFLLMGLGVDDMFVMNACWHNLSSRESKTSLPLRIGYMLKHAGVSIVITSFTDIVALLIGAVTILPSLKSFCIYAAVGVFFIFCYSVTFYVAVFTLDTRRLESNRNGVIFCYRHKKEIKISDDKTCFQKLWAGFYKYVVFTIPGKTIVVLFTIVMAGFSIESILHLEQRFDPKWFIPDDTYYKEYLDKYEHYFPDEGHTAMVFLGKMNYRYEFVKLYDMMRELGNESYVQDTVAWTESFRGYVLKNYGKDLLNDTLVSDREFYNYLSRFLFSPIGGRFQLNFRFSEPFHCGGTATNITASSMTFQFSRFSGPGEYIPAMNHVKEIVKSKNITTGDSYRSVWSKVFANWVTDEVIAIEVERNIELALLCVMLCTVILITNLQMCMWIFICVLLTIINVLGWMQRWGMTVDIVCCIGLELAIGLCVDYAAHVGHTFLTLPEGTRTERALKTVTSIGSAVLLGGGSTLLSLSLLSRSKAYTFQSFFKIFLLVIIFGLFNGLIFLPVILSIMGPNAYKPKEEEDCQNVEIKELNGKEKFIEKEIDDA